MYRHRQIGPVGNCAGPGATREVVEEQGGMKEERNVFMASEHEGDDMERAIRQARMLRLLLNQQRVDAIHLSMGN